MMARSKENVLNIRDTKSIKESEDIGDMYLASIKAKLAILEQFSPLKV